jgi:AAA+ superfamily predicted ATPase
MVFRGDPVEHVAKFIVAMGDPAVSSILGNGNPKWADAVKMFEQAAQPISIRHVLSPGIAFSGWGPSLDGVAMRLRFVEGAADSGDEAFVVPVSRQMLNSGGEWIEHVALVPKRAMARWIGLMGAVGQASRFMMADQMTLRSYNGPDVEVQSITLDDVIMSDSVRRGFVGDLQGFLTKQDWYKRRRLPYTRRYILNGPPGTGKSTLARWAATELGLPAISFDFSDPYADDRTFQSFLTYTRRMSPAIAVLDDFEKVLSGDNRSGVTNRGILTALSGMGSMDGLIVVATSNSMGPFAGPMRRRFDVVVEVALPTAEMRLAYLERLLSEDARDWREGALKAIAERTDGFSVDDLRAAVTAAANSAVGEGADGIALEHMLEAVRAVDADRREPKPAPVR